MFSSASSRISEPRGQPFEEVLHRDLERERKSIQGASGYAIDRPFILLELLKSDPNGKRELFLGYASF